VNPTGSREASGVCDAEAMAKVADNKWPCSRNNPEIGALFYGKWTSLHGFCRPKITNLRRPNKSGKGKINHASQNGTGSVTGLPEISRWHFPFELFSFLRLKLQATPVALVLTIAFTSTIAMADESTSSTNDQSAAETRLGGGIFGWLDPQSAYSQEFFSQPLLVDDTGLEKDGELELNYLHTSADDQHSDIETAEFQKSFGWLTLELGVPYERDYDSGDVSQGLGNIEIGARYPIYQSHSAGRFFDNTLGIAMDLGIPVSSEVSHNAELEPKVFDDLKIGGQFSIQTVLGYSALLRGSDNSGNGGQETFEYGIAFAYDFPNSRLPLPGVQQLTPLFEIVGEKGLNEDESGQNSLLGSIGFRLDLKPIAELQPSVGLGYVFPFDNAAQAEVHWGIVTSLIFEF
jgi:hypothetical protein